MSNPTKVTIVNMTDGTVQVHRPGCADIAKKFRAGRAEHKFTEVATSKYETWLDYNEDFLNECDDWADSDSTNAYDLEWKACCADLVTDGPVIPRTMGEYRALLAPAAPERTYTFADFDL